MSAVCRCEEGGEAGRRRRSGVGGGAEDSLGQEQIVHKFFSSSGGGCCGTSGVQDYCKGQTRRRGERTGWGGGQRGGVGELVVAASVAAGMCRSFPVQAPRSRPLCIMTPFLEHTHAHTILGTRTHARMHAHIFFFGSFGWFRLVCFFVVTRSCRRSPFPSLPPCLGNVVWFVYRVGSGHAAPGYQAGEHLLRVHGGRRGGQACRLRPKRFVQGTVQQRLRFEKRGWC